MKIAFLVDSFPCVSETFILDQITGLIDLGHEVNIFAAKRSEDTVLHEDVLKYGLRDKTCFYNDRPRNRFIRSLKAFLILSTFIFRYPKIMLRALDPWHLGKEALSLNWLFRSALFLEKGPFDILQCHFGGNGLVGVTLKEIGISGAMATMFHGYDIRKGLKAMEEGRDLYGRLFMNGDIIQSISEYNRSSLIRLGAPEHKIVRHPVGVDLKYFAPAETKPYKKGGGIEILSVARLSREKGLDIGIEAFADAAKKLEARYTIIGDGEELESLKDKVSKYGIGEKVVFAGACDRAQVKDLLGKSHIFFLPSRAEALPVSVLEAQAMCLPVVATDVGSVREAVVPGESGLIVERGNVEEMSRALVRIGEDPILMESMGQRGRRHVSSKFDLYKLNKRLESTYYELLRDKRYGR